MTDAPSTELIDQYERDMMTENDYRNTIAFARKKDRPADTVFL